MAFYRCRALREVSLLPGIDEVGNLAFAQSGVKKAFVDGDGRGYGTSIFFGALRLRSVILEEGVRHMPDRFAYGCTSLEEVILPETLESVGKHVWEKTPFLEKWREEGCGGRIFWDGRDLEGEVNLPEQVRVVAGGAFYGNHKITAVHFPEHVIWVGPAALKGCSSLQKVTWPSEITIAEAEIFSGCIGLERVECRGVLGRADLERMEYGGALERADLEKAECKDASKTGAVRWKKVKERAFYGCGKLCGISLEDAEIIEKEAFSGCISLVPGEMNLLKQAGENAFEESVLDKAILGENGLKEGNSFLSVAGSIVVSGESCSGEIRIPEGITAVAPYAFSGKRRITKVFLPESLREIGEGAFWGCSSLIEAVFPSFACRIGGRAFEKCAALSAVYARVSDAGSAAFAYCISLEKAELGGLRSLGYRLFEGCRNLEQCICGQASVIGDHCFSGCGKLKEFDLSSIEEVGSYAFQNCDTLRRISLADRGGGVQRYSSAGGCIDPGDGGIYRCAGISRNGMAGKAEKTFADGGGRSYASGRFGLSGRGDRSRGYPAHLRLGVCKWDGDRKDPVPV